MTGAGTTDDIVISSPGTRNTCGLCRCAVSTDEPIWLLRLPTGKHTFTGGGVAYPLSATVAACRRCALPRIPAYWHDRPFQEAEVKGMPEWAKQLFRPHEGQLFSRCEVCSRPLGRTNSWPDRQCSQRCRKDARNARRRQARTVAICECGAEFTPPRRDAAYCSAACRQRAYRRRKAGAS